MIKNFLIKTINYINNNKIKSIKFAFFFIVFISITKVIFIKPLKNKNYLSSNNDKTLIYDRNGELLTTLKNQYQLILDVSLLKKTSIETQEQVFNLFKMYDKKLVSWDLNQWITFIKNVQSKFIEIPLKNNISITATEKILIGINNNKKILTIKKKLIRHLCYPHSLAYIIGLNPITGYTGPCISNFLSKQPNNIKKIQLTIDIRYQEIIYKNLKKALKEHNADHVWCMMVDKNTGEIVAWVSLPSFNPNDEKIFIDFKNTDKILNYRYEMGSVCKIFSLNFLLSEYCSEEYNENTIINIPHEFKIGKFSIKDASQIDSKLPLKTVFIKSSNKGFASIFASNSNFYHQYMEFFKKLGIQDPINLDNIFFDKPTYLKLTYPQFLTFSYGYGKFFTPIRFTYLLLNVFNGSKQPLHIISQIKNNLNQSVYHRNHNKEKILKDETRAKFKNIFDELGKKTGLPYKILWSGKTGTSKLLKNNKYCDNSINGFLAGVYDDKYLLVLGISDPKGTGRRLSSRYTQPLAISILQDIQQYNNYFKN